MSQPRTARLACTLVLGGLVAGAAVSAPAASAAAPSAPALSRADDRATVPARESGRGTTTSLSDADLWERVAGSDRTAVVGLKAPGRARGVWQGRLLVDGAERAGARTAVLARPGVELLGEDDLLPVLTVRLADAAALRSLRALPHVDYVEPLRFDGALHSDSGSGCMTSAQHGTGGQLWDSYQSPIAKDASGDLVPWNFDLHQVREAWGARKASGAGSTVAVVDTGTFAEQTQLQAPGFSAGPVGSRTVRHFNTGSNPDPADTCNHGTRMAGTVAAPRDGISLVGVAPGAHLNTVKVHDDVWLNGWNVERVALGVRTAVDAGSRVVAMAFGDAWWHHRLADEIAWQHANRNVLFVGAAGTERCEFGVVFPARMEQVVAVTGLSPYGGVHPSACSGPEVDLAAYIGEVPALGRRAGDIITFGGSSDATAVVSGIAALTWSKQPGWHRDAVRDRLYASGSQQTRDSRWGYGAVDAYRATGGFTALSVAGPTSVEPHTEYQLTASPKGDGPFTYRWSNGATTRSITAVSGAARTSQTFSVTVTDLTEGTSRTASKTVASKYAVCGLKTC